MGSCERSVANAHATRKQKTEGEKELSRLAGAGGAAESALMNAQATARSIERLTWSFCSVHCRSLP